MKKLIIMVALAICATACVNRQKKRLQPPTAQVIFLNVGKADAAIIQVDGKSFLIDTGTFESFGQLSTAIDTFAITEFEGVFLTHGDKDHIGGWPSLSCFLPIKQLYLSEYGDIHDKGVKELATEYKISCWELSRNDVIELSENCRVTVLAPSRYNKKDDNDNSLVLMVEIFEYRLLFTGDMTFRQEADLLAFDDQLQADILKVAYHGQNDSSSPEFIKRVQARYAVISTNKDERPSSAHPEVLSRLVDSQVFITENYKLSLIFKLTKGQTIEIIPEQ